MLNCGIIVQAGDSSVSGKCGDFDLDCDFLLDSAGGFLLGLSAMKLVCDGKLSPKDAVSKYISDCESLFPPELTVERLLMRTSGLPDPLREHMLPEVHLLPETDHDDSQIICREHTAILQNRSFEHQRQLVKGMNGTGGCCMAPSLLEEAVLLEIIETAAGISIADYQQRNIFDPLGIKPRCGVHDKGSGSLAYAESEAVEYTAETETAGVLTLTFSELARLAGAMRTGFPMTGDCWNELLSRRLSGQTLPYGRRQGVLQAHSSVCGRHVNIFIDRENDLTVLVTSKTPFLARPDGFGGYRRFDIDLIGYINRQRVYPAHTRMERLSHRNLPSALALSLEPEQQNYVAAPAVVIAEAAAQRHSKTAAQAGGREIFVITDSSITVGIISVDFEPLRGLARLDSLIIDRMYQRHGFGRIAVRWAINYSRREGCTKLVVCVDRRNIAARILYESEGFRLCGVHDSAFVLELGL